LCQPVSPVRVLSTAIDANETLTEGVTMNNLVRHKNITQDDLYECKDVEIELNHYNNPRHITNEDYRRNSSSKEYKVY